jgi:Spy/CpxP family protein refolding chaperone
MKRLCSIITVVLLISFLTVFAVAKPEGFKGGRGHGPMGPHRMHRGRSRRWSGHGVGLILRLKDKLELSEQQVEQLKAIKDEVQEQFKTTAKAVKAQRKALQEAVKSSVAETVIRTTAGELANSLGDQAILKVSTKAKIDAVLTDAQKAQLEELKEQHKERFKDRRGEDRKRGRRPRRGHGKGHGRPRDSESAFTRIDTDENGAISLEEFKAHMERMKEHRGGRRRRGQRMPGHGGPIEQ